MAESFGAADLEAVVPRLRRYARALTGNREAADDLTQDTLERAWNKRALWQSGTDLRAWMFTVMHNVFVNGARRSRPTVSLEDMAADDVGAATATSVETGVVLAELARSLALLPAEQREVLPERREWMHHTPTMIEKGRGSDVKLRNGPLRFCGH